MLIPRRSNFHPISTRVAAVVVAALAILGFSAHSMAHRGFGAQSRIAPPPATPLPLSIAATRRYASEYNWSASPTEDLSSAGTKAIRLSACPSGVAGAEAWYFVYLWGKGMPEAVKVTGGSCKGDSQPGTLEFTTLNPHPNGYTIGSASAGLQEASIAARYLYQNPASRAGTGGAIIVPAAEFNIYARVSIRAIDQTVDFSGSIFNCYADDTCIFVGDPANSSLAMNVTLIGPRGQPMVVNGTKPMIETNAAKTRIFNVSTRQNPAGGTFGTYVQVDDDQAFLLDGLDSNAGHGIHCDAAFCGAVITAPGPFNHFSSVGWLKNMQISNQCDGNGVDWQSGNTVHIADSVIQGFSQFGVRTGTMRGGYGASELTNIYMEVGNCTNPQYPGKGIAARAVAGLISAGTAMVEGAAAPVGQVPEFASAGPTTVYYWVVIKDSLLGSSVPLPVGYAKTDGRAPIAIAWPRVKGTNTVTYDLLRTPDAGSPWTAPSGTGAFAVAKNIAQCSAPVCTATDTNGEPVNYSVALPGYFPQLLFWPGGVVLGPPSDRNSLAVSSALYVDATDFITGVSPIVNALGVGSPTVYAKHCASRALPNTWVSCLAGDSVGNNAIPAATVLQYATVSGGDPADRKGRLIFEHGPASSLIRGHYITLVDSNPVKTMNTRGYRGPNDAADTYIGVDNSSAQLDHAQLALGAPVAISDYIGNSGDGQHWGERLTAKDKTFAVPVVIQQGSTLTVGGGSPLSQMKIYKTPATSATSVPPQHCEDLPAPVAGLTAVDQVTGITPPALLGNLSLNAYVKAANTLTLHFCNASSAAVNSPAGVYSFLAVH